ncbi:hypothetical protein Goshw_024496, partial [Gossypium schwendimanii]|nr:hypothetical protein [Gossypium schwendimanii]
MGEFSVICNKSFSSKYICIICKPIWRAFYHLLIVDGALWSGGAFINQRKTYCKSEINRGKV